MKHDIELPPKVEAKGKWYYYLHRIDRRKVWTKLSLIDAGLPAMRKALADLVTYKVEDRGLPALIRRWQQEVMPKHAPKTQIGEINYGRVIAHAFADFKSVDQITPLDVTEFLDQFTDKPRTFNAHRGMLREYLRFAIQLNFAKPGTNPVDGIIKTMTVKARTRYITDSELRRIKVACMYSSQGRRNQSGPSACALIDMAYLTGQRISDLIALEWDDITDKGIYFRPGKTEASTQAAVTIQWSPKLRDVVRRLREIRLKARLKPSTVFITLSGKSATYNGTHTAWFRAVKRSGVAPCHFHDIRAKALTDKEGREGMQAARKMGTHSTEQQTADYVRKRGSSSTGATR